MEQDRYSYSHKLFIINIISLILSLGLFFFSIYILPYLIWGLHYDVPEFINNLIAYFEYKYLYSHAFCKTITWLIFFIPSLITGYVAYLISNNIDNHLLGIITEEPESSETKHEAGEIKEHVKESIGLASKIIFFMVIVVVIFSLLYQLILVT